MAELRNWQPGWIDRARHTAQGMLAPLFGGDERAAMAYVDDKVKPTLEYMPGVGDAMAAAEARDEFAKGNYGMGGLLAAGAMAGLVPGVGDAVQKGVKSAVKSRGDEVLGLLKAGRADEVTDDMLDMGNAADNANLNAYLFENYDLPMDEASRMGRAQEMGARPEMYHGTDAKTDFQSLKPNTFLTSDVDEANAYSFAGDFKRRQQYSGKFTPVSDVKVPERLEYAGILDDIENPKVGSSYATDNGVFTYKGKGKWEAHTDVGVDYGSATIDGSEMTIGVKKGLPTDAGKYAQEHDEYINRAYPGGDMGRVMSIRTMPQNAQPASAFEANRLGERLGADTSVLQQFPGADVLDTLSDEGAMFMGQKIPQQVVLDPTVARSSFARFDPRLKHLRNLSAGVGGMGLLGAGMLNRDDEVVY